MVILSRETFPNSLRTMACVALCGFALPLAHAADAPLVDGPAAGRYALDLRGERAMPVFVAPGHCAWPRLNLLPDGRTLAAAIFNQPNHGHTAGDVECWLSGDGGTTWSLAAAVTQHEPGTIRMNHAAGVAGNGDLVVLTGGWSDRYPAGTPRARGKFRYATLAPWISRSPDGGHSWLVSHDFPATTPAGAPGTPFGKVERAANGDLCVAVYSTNGPWEKYEQRKFRSFLYRSRDDGHTWGDPVVIGPDSNETTILNLGGGHWLAAARIGTGVEKKDQLLLAESKDDARTWTIKRTMTGFQRVTGDLFKLSDGRVVFSFGERASPFGHRGLEAVISSDEGGSWSAPVRLADWNGLDGGYPSSVQRSDGQVVTAFYSSALPGEPADSYHGYHLSILVWDPSRTFAQS